MKLVVIESPYAGDVDGNVDYCRECMADSLRRGEAPFASHILYTQPGILNDLIPEERKLGTEAGFAWGEKAALVAFYVDKGWSSGMKAGYLRAISRGSPVEIRSLYREVQLQEYAYIYDEMCAKTDVVSPNS